MEDIDFVILHIQILIRANFSEVSQERHCIVDIRKKCIVGSVSKFGKEKMDLVEKLVETVSNVKGYHVYQGIWVPKIGETLSTERESDNPKDK